jgi:PAS domain-containing protein
MPPGHTIVDIRRQPAGAGNGKGARVDPLSVGVAVCDRHLRYVALNPALAVMHGVPHEKHLGRDLREVLGRGARRLEQACEKVMETGQSLANLILSEKWRGRNEAGHWIKALCPIKDKDGVVELVGFLVVEIADPDAMVYLHPNDGRLIAPLEAFQCLKRPEREMGRLTELLVETHRIRRERRTVARPSHQHSAREREPSRPRRAHQQYFQF